MFSVFLVSLLRHPLNALCRLYLATLAFVTQDSLPYNSVGTNMVYKIEVLCLSVFNSSDFCLLCRVGVQIFLACFLYRLSYLQDILQPTCNNHNRKEFYFYLYNKNVVKTVEVTHNTYIRFLNILI